ERGWMGRDEARERVRASLEFFAERAHHEHGWFYHWMHWRTGERMWRSEISSIDTTLLLGGVLTARRYFRAGREVVRLATESYEGVAFQWMVNRRPHLLSHGWGPQDGVPEHHWGQCSAQIML